MSLLFISLKFLSNSKEKMIVLKVKFFKSPADYFHKFSIASSILYFDLFTPVLLLLEKRSTIERKSWWQFTTTNERSVFPVNTSLLGDLRCDRENEKGNRLLVLNVLTACLQKKVEKEEGANVHVDKMVSYLFNEQYYAHMKFCTYCEEKFSSKPVTSSKY